MQVYHVAGEQYETGEPLLPFNALAELGVAVAWKWHDAPVGFDGDVVCVFEDRAAAEDFQAEFGGARILTVTIPDDAADLGVYVLPWGGYISPTLTRVDEGYLAVREGIPAEWITQA